ncbi:MAG: FAD-binding oxidoreductase [Vicinamibacterales bacterium]
MSRLGASYWHESFPRSRRPAYPRFRGQATTDVVVIGGGLTGCACALSFAAAGLKVVLLEADRIGSGGTLGSAGLIREDLDASFHDASATIGLRAARQMWTSMRRASLDFAAVLRRLRIKCDLAPEDLLTLIPREPESIKKARREYQSRRHAGLDHTWLTAAATKRAAAVDAGGAIKTRGSVLDPYRACLGLAAAASARRVPIFEQSPARKFKPTRKTIDVVTESGVIRANAAIVTTPGAPGLQGLRRHLRPRHAYVVVTERLPAAVRREVGPRTAALRDASDPPHLLRWLDGERALFLGAEQPPVPVRAAERVLTQRTGQLMYELSTIYPPISGARAEWAWSTAFDDSVDGLPYIGLHRNFPRQLFALGHGRHGAGIAWLSARILLRQFTNEPGRGDEPFGFSRIL